MDSADPEALDRLMVRLASGDRSAFDGVFESVWVPVHRLCTVLLRHVPDADDAAQQALLKIYEQAPEYDRSKRAMPWVLAIATWECRTIARKRQRRREVYDTKDERTHADAEHDIIRRQLAELAVATLKTMSTVDQESLLATFWETTTTTSGPTLRKRRERALDRLRDAVRRVYGLD